MALTPGTRLGVYEVVAQIGEGGMGQVFRATDTKLKRQVAIKILPPSLAADHDRLARFQREAEVLASLNHPHIAAIYGLEESGGMTALVMELVEGDDLSQRIARGAIPLDEALPVAKQIAEALEAAHEQGIVHRDLKPANIKVKGDGTVKVLDFGLAKTMEPAAGSSPRVSMSPTITTPAMTQAGIILGTAAYMAPEQAKGRAADKRSDIWAFGCVLYEMLTGRRAFDGEDVSDTLAAVLRGEPDWSALPLQTPRAIRRLLYRSLNKDARSRLSDTAMVRVELHDAEIEARDGVGAQSAVAPRRPSALGRIGPYVAVIGAALVTGLAVWSVRRPVEEPRPIVRFSIDLPDREVQSTAERNYPVAISRDGSDLVYVANGRLYLRALNQLDATPIAGSEPGGIIQSPFFSPDGRWIAFWEQQQLKKVPVSGGAPVTICDVSNPPVGASWEPNDEILLGTGPAGILHVQASGGRAEPLFVMKNGEGALSPEMLPGGEWVLFVTRHVPLAPNNQGQVVVQSRATGERRVLIEGATDVRYLASKYLIFGRGNGVLVQAFDPAHLKLSGEAVPVLDGVATATTTVQRMFFAVSASGTLLYVPGTATATVSTKLVQVARDGSRSPLADVASVAWFPRFSPEGSRVAYGDGSDLWVLDVTRGARTRVTFPGNGRFLPIWTRDGTRLTFADGTTSSLPGIGTVAPLRSALADGSGRVETVLGEDTRRIPTSWSPDGRTLAFYTSGNTTKRDIWMLHVDGAKRITTPFLVTPFNERGAIFSPNGRWVAYVSNKSGRDDIYARPSTGPGDELTISVSGGQEPVWAPSGRELFYRHDGKLLAVRIEESATSLTVGAPTRLFDDGYRLDTTASLGGVANYDISPDGRRFVMVEDSSSASAAATLRLRVILNWQEELKQRLPTR